MAYVQGRKCPTISCYSSCCVCTQEQYDWYWQCSNEPLQLDCVSELAFTSWSCELRRAAACVIQNAFSSILTLWVTNSWSDIWPTDCNVNTHRQVRAILNRHAFCMENVHKLFQSTKSLLANFTFGLTEMDMSHKRMFYKIQWNEGLVQMKRGRLHWRSHEKGWVLSFQHVKDRFVLPTFWSECTDLLQGKDEAIAWNTCHYIALHPIKCCHWNCQLAPQVFWLDTLPVFFNAAIQHLGSSRPCIQ